MVVIKITVIRPAHIDSSKTAAIGEFNLNIKSVIIILVTARDIAASRSLDEKTTINAAIIKIISSARIRFKIFLQKLSFSL
jgi:hypothetical protein